MGTAYTARERFALWLLGAGGLVGLNGAFIYGLMASPGSLQAALSNPVALALPVALLWRQPRDGNR